MTDSNSLIFIAVFVLMLIAAWGWYVMYGADYLESKSRKKKREDRRKMRTNVMDSSQKNTPVTKTSNGSSSPAMQQKATAYENIGATTDVVFLAHLATSDSNEHKSSTSIVKSSSAGSSHTNSDYSSSSNSNSHSSSDHSSSSSSSDSASSSFFD